MKAKFSLWLRALVCVLALGQAASAGVPGEPKIFAHSAERELEPEAPPRVASEPKRGSCVLADPGRYPGVYREDAWPEGEVALTFDDGPYPGKTKAVLDLLAKHGFSATFFVVGMAIRRGTYPLIQRMVAEGHTIGTHTYSHDLQLSAGSGPNVADYVAGQYALTQVMVELALLARSPDDFDALHQRVFERPSAHILANSTVRKHWRTFVARHAELLRERGYAGDRRPYPMHLARPPGGAPYHGKWSGKSFRENHERGLAELGLVNVLWHGGSGDTDRERARDFAFLTGNLHVATRRGGVLLIHDRMRTDALKSALAAMAKNPRVRVVSLYEALERKYACSLPELGSLLASEAEAAPSKPPSVLARR